MTPSCRRLSRVPRPVEPALILTRRQILAGAGGLALGAGGFGAWAAAGETLMTPLVRRYRVTPARWPDALTLRIGVISDIHACEPWMPAERVHAIAQQCNALDPDLILLLGDFNAGHRLVSGPVMPGAWAEALSVLRAPLGTYAILGNHDWWHGPVPGMPGGPEEVRRALRGIGVERPGEPRRPDRGGRAPLLARRHARPDVPRPSGACGAHQGRHRRDAGAGHRRGPRGDDGPRAQRLPLHARARRPDAVRPHPRRADRGAGLRADRDAVAPLQLRPHRRGRPPPHRVGRARRVRRAGPPGRAARDPRT